MLEFVKIKHPDQIKILLKEFNPGAQTWIVSDLKSKHEIQRECIQRYGFFTDDSILRISDFWRIWIRRLKPTLQVVASDFIKSLVQQFIVIHGSALDLTETDSSALEKYVQELAPIILHPESDSLLTEWLSLQKSARNWQKWYSISRVCILFILNQKKAIDSKWSAAFLQSLDLQMMNWDSEIIVDLGTELTSIEMGIFKVLSQRQKIKIYVPSPEWKDRFPFLLKTYSENFGYGTVSESDYSAGANSCKKTFIRLSTQLAEVKFAVSQVRQWLDEGVKPEQISVIALRIEDYWPVLESYLFEEGITFQKDSVAGLNGLASVQIFLAHIKSLSSEVDFESLQQKYYQTNSVPEIKFEKFKALFNQLFDEENLKRDENIKDLFYRKVDFKQKISRDEFFSFLIKIWAELPEAVNTCTIFEILFRDLLSQSLETSMKTASWFQFLKARLSHKEIKIANSSPGGIHITSLMSAQMADSDHRIYMGLFEEAFKVNKKSMLPLKDIEILKNQFDLAIAYPEESHLDFNLRWQIESQCKAIILTTPHLSFAAEPLTACLFFLENNPKSEVTNPKYTRWDEIQKSLARGEADCIGFYADQVSEKRVREDLIGAEILVQHQAFTQLAASEVETYARCSFKLLASKGFRLRDLPEVSIDLDPREKGTLVHALFEYIINNFKSTALDIVEVERFLEIKRKELHLFINEENFWQVQLNKLLLLAQKFSQFENSRTEKFKSLTEVSFELYFDPILKIFSNTNGENHIAIRGRIDRLDQNLKSNYYLIYDYKSSQKHAKNFSKWMTEYQFQLMLYIFAVEVCLFEKSEVKGALYYLYKNFDVSKGLVDTEVGLKDLDFSKLAKSLAIPEQVDKLKSEFINFISECISALERGEFAADPLDTVICAECDWRKLCRAKHLM